MKGNIIPGTEEQIRTGNGYVISYLNFAVPDLKRCSVRKGTNGCDVSFPTADIDIWRHFCERGQGKN
jgi:hypothetical protein